MVRKLEFIPIALAPLSPTNPFSLRTKYICMEIACCENQPMSRVSAFLVVVAVWAVVYLPALGSLAIKGEEGRRILPAIQMLKTGDYVVPQVGSTTYFRKPPLVNWLVAASFRVFGVRNEWTARLPSALAVLAVAIAFITVARASLGPNGSTLAALIWLTNVGMIEKGRLIEIEGLYVSLCGLAMIFWLSCWTQKKSAWLTWVPASIFLGLGILAKGPTLLVFFYAIVLAVLWQAKNWRFLSHPAHFTGIVIMLAIFAAWGIPFTASTTMHLAVHKWSIQFSERLRGTDFQFLSWIQNVPRGLGYFLPWLVLVPFVRFSRFEDGSERHIARGLAWGILIPFLAINLVPGAAARYSMPYLVPASWFMAMSYSSGAVRWPEKMGNERVLFGVTTAFVLLGLAIGGVGYPLAAVVLHNRQQIKRAAATFNAALPANEPVYAVDPRYVPVLFYVREPLEYVNSVADLPGETHYFLVRADTEKEAAATQKWAPRKAYPIARATDYTRCEMILFEVKPEKRSTGSQGN
jgi:4-amino-4-deoxy-L-arabinose transferase-like glycosyltransferase